MTPRMRSDVDVDQPSPELESLLEQFGDEEIETGVLARGAGPAADSERHTAKFIESLLGGAVLERSLGQLMRSTRERAGHSLADVALRLGVTRSRVHQLEREGANLELHTLERYANALGYEVRIMFVARSSEAPEPQGAMEPTGASE